MKDIKLSTLKVLTINHPASYSGIPVVIEDGKRVCEPGDPIGLSTIAAVVHRVALRLLRQGDDTGFQYCNTYLLQYPGVKQLKMEDELSSDNLDYIEALEDLIRLAENHNVEIMNEQGIGLSPEELMKRGDYPIEIFNAKELLLILKTEQEAISDLEDNDYRETLDREE